MCLHYVAKKNGRKIARYRCTTTFQRGWKACPIKEVNADQIERWAQDQVARLAADGSLLDAAIAAANAADEDRAGPLRHEREAVFVRIEEVRAKVDRLVEAIASSGSGFHAIRAKLTLESRNLRLLEHDRARIDTEIDRVAGDPLDPATLRHVLKDFDALSRSPNQPNERSC